MSYGLPTAGNDSAGIPVCPRHPDRVAYVRCQRCGRPACTECQRPAAVGIQCVDCVAETARSTARPRTITGAVIGSDKPIVSYVLIALCAVAFLLTYVPGVNVGQQFFYAPLLTEVEPWRMLTSIFMHSSPIHLVVNMYSLYFLGRALEPLFGWARFLTVYLISGLAGSVGVLLLANPAQAVVGASGAIFGLFGAFFVVQLKNRGDLRMVLVLLVINGAMGFLLPNIAWQAHLGGLIAGAAVAAAFVYLPVRQKILGWGASVAMVLILIVLTMGRLMFLPSLF